MWLSHRTNAHTICGLATGQMPRPYAPSPYLDTGGNLRVSLLRHLSLGDILAKCCLGLCDISLHLLLCCWWLARCKAIWRFPWIAVPFLTGTCHVIVWKKAYPLGSHFDSLRARSLCYHAEHSLNINLLKLRSEKHTSFAHLFSHDVTSMFLSSGSGQLTQCGIRNSSP